MKHALIAVCCCIAVGLQAQNVGIGTSSPNANAKLDITATDKGVLIPRMDSVHRKAIPNTIGLLVYDSTTKSFWFNNGTAWQNMASAGSGWSLTGNSGLDAGNFFGTTDNSPINLKFNNQPAGKISNGTVSIGAGAFSGNGNDGPFLTAIGAGALHNNTLNPNTATGGYSNTAVGQSALFSNTTGNDNAALGSFTLQQTTTGKYNTAVGSIAMQNNVSGSSNTSVGYSALGNSISGNSNTAVGASALLLNAGNENTAVGVAALRSNTVSNNSAFGFNALAFNSDGTANTAMGSSASEKNTHGGSNTGFGAKTLYFNTTGSYNTAMGVDALIRNTSNFNTGLGYRAMSSNTDGQSNTGVGSLSLGHNISGSFNTALGYLSDVGALDLTNATAIGANAVVDASNKIRLGDANVTVVESNGVFNTVSDGRFKYNVKEDVKGLAFILKLRPVTYQFDTKKQEDFSKGHLSAEQLNNPVIPAAFNENSSIKRTGFIAQEVENAAQKTGYDFDGVKIPASEKQYYSLSYASFVVPLVKAVQEQQQTIDTLKKQNEILRQQNEQILKRLEALEKK